MPRTAYLMARSLGLPYNEGLLTGAPDYNVRLGSHYLKTLLARYDDETALAVAAYNAGPSRVDEWLRLHGDPRRRGDRYDVIDWVELIPFDETRNYVERVLEGRNMYRRRLAEPQVATGAVPPGQRAARAAAGAGAEAARSGARGAHRRRRVARAPRPRAQADRRRGRRSCRPPSRRAPPARAAAARAQAAAICWRRSTRRGASRCPSSSRAAVMTAAPHGRHPRLRVRRLRHAVRRPLGGRPAARARSARRPMRSPSSGGAGSSSTPGCAR